MQKSPQTYFNNRLVRTQVQLLVSWIMCHNVAIGENKL